MTVSIIVAAAENNVIGKDNELPWHIPADFKYFKDKTSGHACIMGRKTYESICDQLGKPLPNRTSIVVTRQTGYNAEYTAGNLGEAIKVARKQEPTELFIIGGADIYKQSLDNNVVDRIYFTRVYQSPEGDAYFPVLDETWQEISRDDRDGFSFLVYEK